MLANKSLTAPVFGVEPCKKSFNQRINGINPYQRVTELFKEQVGLRHHHGTSKRTTAMDLGVGEATVERYYHRFLTLTNNKTKNASCPKILGIDEKHWVYINNGGSQDFCYTWLTKTKITKGTPKCPRPFTNLSLVYQTSKSFPIAG